MKYFLIVSKIVGSIIKSVEENLSRHSFCMLRSSTVFSEVDSSFGASIGTGELREAFEGD
jgi:hypothetical protein